jgi:hypothetical protein
MTNFAVCLESIQGEEFFQKLELIVSMGDRSLHLKKGEIGYFSPLVVDGLLYYYISYLNDDGEGQNGSIKTLTPTANAQYNFIYNVETNTVQIDE